MANTSKCTMWTSMDKLGVAPEVIDHIKNDKCAWAVL